MVFRFRLVKQRGGRVSGGVCFIEGGKALGLDHIPLEWEVTVTHRKICD